ncbi:lytic murein transglycosylase [Amaricoccus tamworthensis]|uniref:lytic murein transglycosylase n=1 Tax=Amaricoccus tamworthensis TaxID=57002 RepID=UPI003C7E241A
MRPLSFSAAILSLIIGGCGVQANSTPDSGPSPMHRSVSPQPGDFVAWRDGFRSRAIAQGIAPATFDAAFRGVGVNQQVVDLDSRQAEFTKPIWEYLDTAVSDDRVANGRAKQRDLNSIMAAIENRYGVDSQTVLAIWGMETNYGTFRGDIPVIESLATLAYEGRRRSFAEEQLIAALRIIQAGDITPDRMRGSWAGAMGHTQFIPTSYLSTAVDFTGDGRRDVWSEDPTDALASAANYLADAGWQYGQPWGLEVRLPQGFNWGSVDQSNRRPVTDWTSRGVTLLSGAPLPDYGTGAIIAPAGVNGPAFIVYQNFYVIKRYNNSTSYAVGVGHLGDRIAGGGPFVQSWPRGDRNLSRTEKMDLQEKLTAAGYDTGGTDGIIGPDTAAAIRRFQADNGMTPDGYPSSRVLQALR